MTSLGRYWLATPSKKAFIPILLFIYFSIFIGFENPFYNQSMNKKGLDSRTYHSSDLPSMTSKVPPIIESLVRSMLKKNPDQRLSAEEAATICQLLLWAPRSWTIGIGSGHLPSSQDILQWLLTMTTKTLYECRFFNKLSAHVEYQLLATVLSRLTMANVKKSLNWLRNQNTI